MQLDDVPRRTPEPPGDALPTPAMGVVLPVPRAAESTEADRAGGTSALPAVRLWRVGALGPPDVSCMLVRRRSTKPPERAEACPRSLASPERLERRARANPSRPEDGALTGGIGGAITLLPSPFSRVCFTTHAVFEDTLQVS